VKELTYPQDLSEQQLYNSVKDVLNQRGYKDLNGDSEALYNSEAVTVEVSEQVLEITGPSSSEEQVIAKLLEPELE
jgi:hypothetical protein